MRELVAVTPVLGAKRGWEGCPKETANLPGKALTLTNVCISLLPTGSGCRTSITFAEGRSTDRLGPGSTARREDPNIRCQNPR